jgi:hypothetical protein
MEAIYLFILLLIGLTIILGIILGDSSRTDVIAHWAERRCDLDVIIAAFTYKPDEDTRGVFEFAADNFKFCVSSKTTDYLNTIFGALFEVLRKQMGAADVMSNVMKTLRVQLNSIYAPFSTMMQKFWAKFKQMGALSSRIFQHLYMSMKKAAASAVASVFVAISLQTAFLNGIDLVIKIIMIVLYILIALAIIFFLPILPVLIFVFMATAGIESAFPGRTGGMGAVFCFAPDTLVVMSDLSLKRIDQIKLGDILLSNQTVSASIEVPGSGAPLYSIDGVLVSGDHRVWNVEKQDWILVKEDPSAIKTTEVLHTLWTLITSNRQIPVASSNDVKLFADWEELPTSDESAIAWESIVRSILTNTAFKSTTAPKHAPCFDKTILVMKYQAGWVPISTIKRGDWIMNDKRWTRVIGTCEREVDGGIGDKGVRMSDGVWLKGGLGGWEHPKGTCDTWKWQGCNLITDSGSFNIRLHNSTDHIVRDFTEVGWMNLSKTYTRVGAMMAIKKDALKEED